MSESESKKIITSDAQDVLNKTFSDDIRYLKKDVAHIKDKMNQADIARIKEIHEIKGMIVEVFDEKLEPFLEITGRLGARIDMLEDGMQKMKDAPKDKALQQKNWIINTLLGVVITMLGMLLNAIYGFLPF